MIYLLIYLYGIIAAIGLGIAQMTRPAKVINVLNVFGDIDFSLHFVMAGAMLTYAFLFRLVRRRKKPLLGDKWRIPTRTDITPSLFIGAALFGIGWGISGICPGPALAELSSGVTGVYVFFIGLVFGIALSNIFTQERIDKLFK